MINYAYESGCCLNCEDARPGCLCYNCKCTKCEAYIPPEDWDGEKGKCGLTVHTHKETMKYYDCKPPKKQPPKPDVKTVSYKKAFDKEDWTEV